jgi:hypothetical protein
MLNMLWLAFLLSSGKNYAQVDSLYYHDNSFESQYGASGAFPSTDYLQAVARFTPAVYPAKLVGIRAYFRNAADPAPFRFIVYSDPSGSAAGPVGTYTYASTPNVNPASTGNPDTVYSSYADLSAYNLVCNAGDFYCGVTQYSQLNGFVGAALDGVPQNNAVNDRQWISTGEGAAGTWFQMLQWAGGGQWGFTAFFDYMTGTSSIENENQFAVYPDPVIDKLIIQKLEVTGKDAVDVSIYNAIGEKKIEATCAGNPVIINCELLSPGMYYIEVADGAGIYRSKFVKEN